MILNVYKPKGLTSHDMVDRVRRITNERRVGHGGTLDPLAEGILIVGVGRESTKKLEGILKGTDKEYEALIELGKTSTTDDGEGVITPVKSRVKHIDKSKILSTLKHLTGPMKQTPPAYSAVKVSGRPAYKLARKGINPHLKQRTVEVREARLLSFDFPTLKVRFIVSSGTYIRSLARDLGEHLGTGAYLKELVRTRVGEFKLKDSIQLDDLAQELQVGDTKKA